MNFDKLSKEERYDVLSEIADMYYNQGKTQVEIAEHFSTTRFKIAKLLQDARAEQVVEITINFTNGRNKTLEQELKQAYPLNKAIVVNTQYSSYADSCSQVGQVGAVYVNSLLTINSVLGIAWGKTIQTIVKRLPQTAKNHISVVQIAGHISLSNPTAESRELVRSVAFSHFGNPYYINAPLYINDPEVRQRLFAEPDVYRTLCKAKDMTVFLTGVGSKSSLPLTNPLFRPYLSVRDRESAGNCMGSILGYVFNAEGHISDIDLNQKVVAVPMDDLLQVPHRIGMAYGRHKAASTRLVINNGFINELITDTDTALSLIDMST
ncbi:MAG: hypothetical protein HFG63_15420 [Lachnospiraceae bacterium]|nr:hypothetical protein [Lachnospiraceae bacterium]